MSLSLQTVSRVSLSLLLLLPFAHAAAQHTTDSTQMTEGPAPVGTVAPTKPPEPALMNNDTVLRMVRAGLGDDLIVQTINTQPGSYIVGPDDLIALKKAGVSEPVLAAMMSPKRRQITSVPTQVVVSDVNEPGVYYKDRQGRWQLMESEIVHVKSGGFIKSHLTNGIIREDRNGVVSGRESKLLLPRPIDFMIYTPEGITGSEYDLLRFRLNSKDREFRTLTGGVFHSTGGAERDEQPFKPVQTAPHTWTFAVAADTPGGEYGILPPGTGNVTNGGKIYTFAISE